MISQPPQPPFLLSGDSSFGKQPRGTAVIRREHARGNLIRFPNHPLRLLPRPTLVQMRASPPRGRKLSPPPDLRHDYILNERTLHP